MKIEVGEYVRTDKGILAKIDKEMKNLQMLKFLDVEYGNIVKHSPNLKDLIQKDDFVNGDRVVAIDYTEDENGNYVDVLGIMEIDDDYAYPIELRVINIQEVVTKEMMESISYKIKE